MLSLSYVMSSGYNYYWTAAGSLEVQKAALFGTRLLAKDLELSNINTVEVQDDTAVPPLDGIVFAMPSDLAGVRQYNEKGKIIWQSYVGYYVQNVKGVNSIIRNQQAVATPSILTPLPSADGVTPISIAALP